MLNKWDELKLIARCVAGDDRRAFEQLVTEHSDPLRRFLLNLTLGNAALTDDLAQDTFLKAWLQLRTFRGMARFRTWLFRIAVNEFNDYCRSRHYEPPGSDPPDEGASPGWDGGAGAIEANLDLKRCMAVLTAQERMAVLLRYLQEFPVKRVAEIMQMPEGTVKSHLFRARSKMEHFLTLDDYK